MAEQHAGYDSIAIIPEFVADRLRETMVLGLPPEDQYKPTFYFDKVVEWEQHDSANKPWDWADAPLSEVQRSPVRPIVAYEFFSPLGRQGDFPTEAGDFNPTTLIFTLLEEEWSQVRGFSSVTVGPSAQTWLFRYWRPSYGLDSMAVFQIHCAAEGVP